MSLLPFLALTVCIYRLLWPSYEYFGLPKVSALSVEPKPTRLQRAVSKAVVRFAVFGGRDNSTIVVDGNNVRGSANFRWNPLEVQGRICSFCQEYKISRAVVIWDHGMTRFATPTHKSDINDFDMVVLFSGLSQRADNVMIKESTHLANSFCENDWSSLCFVTNDRGLQGKLIGRSHASSPTVRPFLMDSTRFVELLESHHNTSCDITIEKQFTRISGAQDSFLELVKLRKTKYNPSREPTWQRCVLGEELRRSYTSCPNQVSPPSSFSNNFIRDLQDRGYSNPGMVEKQASRAILGPARLDKRQRGMLVHYNRVMKNA